MPTNIHINNFNNAAEKSLIEDLIIESIKFYGMDMIWLPRETVNQNQIYGEDTLSKFSSWYTVEMYIKNIEGFEGEGDFISRFGLEIRDQVTLTLSQKRFGELVSPYPRPREGDLIFMPLNKKFFEIMHVEHESIFYQVGALPVYDLRCELFGYSNEEFDLIGPDSDLALAVSDLSAISQVVTVDSEVSMPDSSTADNKTIEEEADSILDFNDSNPFGTY